LSEQRWFAALETAELIEIAASICMGDGEWRLGTRPLFISR
jgi:hypothetical protein